MSGQVLSETIGGGKMGSLRSVSVPAPHHHNPTLQAACRKQGIELRARSPRRVRNPRALVPPGGLELRVRSPRATKHEAWWEEHWLRTGVLPRSPLFAPEL